MYAGASFAFGLGNTTLTFEDNTRLRYVWVCVGGKPRPRTVSAAQPGPWRVTWTCDLSDLDPERVSDDSERGYEFVKLCTTNEAPSISIRREYFHEEDTEDN